MFDCKVLHTLGKFSLIQWKVEGDLQQLDGQHGQQGFFVSQLVVHQEWLIILHAAIMCLVILVNYRSVCNFDEKVNLVENIFFGRSRGGFHLLCPHLQSPPMVCQVTDMADADAGVDTVSGDDAALAVADAADTVVGATADADAGVLPWFSGFST